MAWSSARLASLQHRTLSALQPRQLAPACRRPDIYLALHAGHPATVGSQGPVKPTACAALRTQAAHGARSHCQRHARSQAGMLPQRKARHIRRRYHEHRRMHNLWALHKSASTSRGSLADASRTSHITPHAKGLQGGTMQNHLANASALSRPVSRSSAACSVTAPQQAAPAGPPEGGGGACDAPPRAYATGQASVSSMS